MSQDPTFSSFEKSLILKLIKRCALYVNSWNTSQPEDQDNCLQIDDECQIEEMKNWSKRQKSLYVSGDTTQPLGCPKSIGQVYVGNIKDYLK